tara:strand:+ start:291 stop:506 length:216 start_codon:yes stop_codon:yes gene_type:complete
MTKNWGSRSIASGTARPCHRARRKIQSRLSRREESNVGDEGERKGEHADEGEKVEGLRRNGSQKLIDQKMR